MFVQAPPASPPAQERAIVLLLAAIHFTYIMDFMVMMPLGPQLMRLYHLTPQQFGFLVAAYSVCSALSGIWAAFHIDRFDRKSALLFCYAGFTLATLMCALAPGFYGLLAARAAAGLFGGVVGSTEFALLGDVIPESRRGAATGTVMAGFSLSAIVGVPSGLMLAAWFDWRAPFFLLTVVCLVVLLAARRILPAVRGHLDDKRSSWMRFRAIVGKPLHLRAFAFMAVLVLSGFTVVPFISPYMVANVGMAEADLAWIYLCGGLATLVTSRFAGRMADRYGHRQVFAVIALISVAPIFILTHLPPVSLGLALLTTTVFMVCTSGRFVPGMALITSCVPPQVRGGFMSLNIAVQQAAAGLASLGAGVVLTRNATGQIEHYGSVGLFAMGMTLLAIALAWSLRPPPGPPNT